MFGGNLPRLPEAVEAELVAQQDAMIGRFLDDHAKRIWAELSLHYGNPPREPVPLYCPARLWPIREALDFYQFPKVVFRIPEGDE